MTLFRKVLCFLLIAAGLTSSDVCAQISLERVSKKRFNQAFAKYVKQQDKTRLKRIAGYALLGVGVVGVSAWAISSMTKPNSTSTGNTNTGGANTRNNGAQQNFWASFREALKQGAAYSFAGVLFMEFADLWRGGYSYLKSFFCNCPDEMKNELRPYAKRLHVELDRLLRSMVELQKHGDNQSLITFYKQEIIGAFKILVKSLEKFGAILFWHVRKSNKQDQTVLDECNSGIDNLFLFCDSVAHHLETDLNQSGQHAGFSQTTHGGVASLRRAILFFAGNIS